MTGSAGSVETEVVVYVGIVCASGSKWWFSIEVRIESLDRIASILRHGELITIFGAVAKRHLVNFQLYGNHVPGSMSTLGVLTLSQRSDLWCAQRSGYLNGLWFIEGVQPRYSAASGSLSTVHLSKRDQLMYFRFILS
ncbi:hypothetical protein Tco_0546853 [Tanacetum coccineum]